MSDGGYDEGYSGTACLWGTQPGSFVELACRSHLACDSKVVLDAGCGEGKNSAYLASRGAIVDSYDISSIAIEKARHIFGAEKGINWIQQDIQTADLEADKYDAVVAYGLFHCLGSEAEVGSLVKLLQEVTKSGGIHVVCAFNDGPHDLSAHPGFNPCLVSHAAYLDLYENFTVLEESNCVKEETHPHNNIPHFHSLTRFIARKD